MRNTDTSQRDQRGMVAILVTMIMMLVITLIVIGFAQVTRRNQRAALDRQLSSQAYYAAESGVNDAVQYVKSNLASLDSLPADTSTNCSSFIGVLKTATGNADINVLSDENGVSYNCLLVNPHPPTITVKPLPVGKAVVVPLKSASGNWSSFTFAWDKNSGSSKTGNCPTPGRFPPVDNSNNNKWNCNYGILRVDLIDTATITPAQDGNSDSVATFYLVPGGGSGKHSYATGATLVPTTCSDGTCTSVISFPSPSSSSYYARLSMLYNQSDRVTINGKVTPGNVTGYFTGSVVVIDATGKAQDQLRRMQVVLPLTGSANGVPLPTSALQTTSDLCKYFTIAPGDNIPSPANTCS